MATPEYRIKQSSVVKVTAQAVALGPQIDDLLALRDLLKKAQDAERKLTAQVMGTLQDPRERALDRLIEAARRVLR